MHYRHTLCTSNQHWFCNRLHTWQQPKTTQLYESFVCRAGCKRLRAGIWAHACPLWVMETCETVLLWAMPSPWRRGNSCQWSRSTEGAARNWGRRYAGPLASVFVTRTDRQSITVCLHAHGCGWVRLTQILVFKEVTLSSLYIVFLLLPSWPNTCGLCWCSIWFTTYTMTSLKMEGTSSS